HLGRIVIDLVISLTSGFAELLLIVSLVLLVEPIPYNGSHVWWLRSRYDPARETTT
ncbi:MAG: hypothetical protein RL564_1877, partial [Pseudomonadota bacterium]